MQPGRDITAAFVHACSRCIEASSHPREIRVRFSARFPRTLPGRKLMVVVFGRLFARGSTAMSFAELPTIARFREDSLEVFVYENRALAGRAAAHGIVQAIRSRQRAQGMANIVFAAAPSQNEFLAGLVAANDIDWSRVAAFHMDEYLGIDADHPVSFRRYLQEHLFRLVGLGADGSSYPRRASRAAAANLPGLRRPAARANPTDIVCAGHRRERPSGVQRPAGCRLPRSGARQGGPARCGLPQPAAQ